MKEFTQLIKVNILNPDDRKEIGSYITTMLPEVGDKIYAHNEETGGYSVELEVTGTVLFIKSQGRAVSYSASNEINVYVKISNRWTSTVKIEKVTEVEDTSEPVVLSPGVAGPKARKTTKKKAAQNPEGLPPSLTEHGSIKE